MARRKQDKTSPAKIISWKAGLYIRLSREDGNDVSLSVVNQEKILRAYVAEHEDEIEVFDTYIDDGCTGTDTDRIHFQRLVRDITEKKVNCVIVKDLSRLSRNVSDVAYYLSDFYVRHDVRFICRGQVIMDSAQSPESSQNLLVMIMAAFNDQQAEDTSNKIRAAQDELRRQGYYLGGHPVYGYQLDPDKKGHLIIDNEAAAVVREIFDYFVNQGMSKRGIAQRLNELGIPNRTAYKKFKGSSYKNPNSQGNDGLWDAKAVNDVLQNEIYIGHMVQGREKIKSYKVHDRVKIDADEWVKVENTHEAIIDEVTFTQAQFICSKDTRTPDNSRKMLLFSGFLHCADCGKGMARKKAKGGLVYHNCRTYKDKSKAYCTPHTIREDRLEAAVLAAIHLQIDHIASLMELVEQINKAPKARIESIRLNELLSSQTEELHRLEEAVDEVYMDWKMRAITKDQYERRIEKAHEKAANLQSNIEKLQAEIQVHSTGVKADDPFFMRFMKYQEITRLERALLTELVDDILIHEGGAITIKFKYADQYQLIADYVRDSISAEDALIQSA